MRRYEKSHWMIQFEIEDSHARRVRSLCCFVLFASISNLIRVSSGEPKTQPFDKPYSSFYSSIHFLFFSLVPTVPHLSNYPSVQLILHLSIHLSLRAFTVKFKIRRHLTPQQNLTHKSTSSFFLCHQSSQSATPFLHTPPKSHSITPFLHAIPSPSLKPPHGPTEAPWLCTAVVF